MCKEFNSIINTLNEFDTICATYGVPTDMFLSEIKSKLNVLRGHIENKDAIIAKLTKEKAELSHQLDLIDSSDLVW